MCMPTALSIPSRRRVVGSYRAVLVVLIYLRHSLSQALVAELFGCSQPTCPG